jgi:hypothetical protein
MVISISHRRFSQRLEDRYPERGFDFSKDYEVLTELGQTLIERANVERESEERRREWLRAAAEQYEKGAGARLGESHRALQSRAHSHAAGR